jgi:thiamine biosynthesis lipoprotein
MMIKKISFVTLVLLLCFSGCSSGSKRENLIHLNGATMGTTYSIKVVIPDGREAAGPDESFDGQVLKREIEEILFTINRLMSTYMQESELSRFNRSRKTDWFKISSDTFKVLAQAMQISERSNGAFDITVGPLVNLWGFGPVKRQQKIPENKEIEEVLKFVGYQMLEIRHQPPAIRKMAAGMYCDLSAIAKGFAVDRVAEYLQSRLIRNYMVEIGGEVRTQGKNQDNRWWRIGIAVPSSTPGVQRVIALVNSAMATSGDYRNYYEKDGRRYSHTIDPRNGKPITHKLASVTVIHPSCMIADGMATAITVLGPSEGFDLAVKENLAVFMIIRGKKGFVEKSTPAFSKYLTN